MRRALKWLVGAVGLAALARLRSRRRAPAGVPVAEDPAEELRRKLADQRDEQVPDDEADAVPDPVYLDERRAEVHARAQDAIESMREGETQPDSPGADSPDSPGDDAVA